MDLSGGPFRCLVRTTAVLLVVGTGREQRVWDGCSLLCPAGHGPTASGGGAVRAFQGAQDHPQISATYQEGLGGRRVTPQAGTRAFLRFSIKNESIQGTCCESGTPSAFLGRRHSIGQQPGEPSPVIGPIWERKQGRHREGRWFAHGHTAGRW